MRAQAEGEGQAAGGAVFGLDGAAVPSDSVADYGQTEACAARLSRAPLVDAIEAFEDLAKMLRGYSAAIVGNGEYAPGIDR